MINTQIQNYKVLSLIGEGGMGNVYLAEHISIQRKVAIKVLKSDLIKNEELRIRFKNEASLMAKLQHPNIVGLFDYYEDENGLYLIMEYVEGLPLDEYIEKVSGPIPEEIALPMMVQISEAFKYAHEHSIIHRDIKPSNFIVTNDGLIKALDFGIAKILSDTKNLTRTGTQIGTVYYMSPEQVEGKQLDARSDIYSLGVTFFQMLTGKCPYVGLTTDFEVYKKIVDEPLPPTDTFYPGVSKNLNAIISNCTAKNKENRYSNCNDLLLDLKSKNVDSKLQQKEPNKPIAATKQVEANTVTAKNTSVKSVVIGLSALLVIGVVYFLSKDSKEAAIASPETNEIGLDTSQVERESNNSETAAVETAVEADEFQSHSKAAIRNSIQNYYSAIASENYDAWDHFAGNILQFIQLKNISPDDLNVNHQKNTEFVEAEASIINDEVTFDYNDGAIEYWSYWVDFSCYRTKKQKYQFCKIKIQLGIDESLKFVSYKEIKVTDLQFEDYR